MWLAFSVDLEPNKDDTMTGIEDAMQWFDATVPRGTVYATYRIATERPTVLESLAETHEIGVHVHPREFGHDHDQLARLSPDRQRELIDETRTAIADAISRPADRITAFRAGRHSASLDTLAVLADLGFDVDASVNVRYDDYLPDRFTSRIAPGWVDDVDGDLLELPTTYYRPSVLSRAGLRVFPGREVTATANTLRTDSRICSGYRAIRELFANADPGVSMYMHPYDATDHHTDLPNAGAAFRKRVERLLTDVSDRYSFVTAADVRERAVQST